MKTILRVNFIVQFTGNEPTVMDIDFKNNIRVYSVLGGVKVLPAIALPLIVYVGDKFITNFKMIGDGDHKKQLKTLWIYYEGEEKPQKVYEHDNKRKYEDREILITII